MKRCRQMVIQGLLLCVVLLLSACNSDDDDNPVPPGTDRAGATFDFYNLYLEDADMIFQFDGSDASSHLGYLWGSTKRTVQWNAAQSHVQLRVLRADARTELTRGSFVFEDAGKYICFVTGDRPEDAFTQVNVRDDSPPAAGLARVRMFHALPGDADVDVYIGGTTPAHKLISGLGWRSMSPYITVDPQALTDTLMIVEAASPPIPQQALVFIAQSNVYHAGSVYTLAAIRSQPSMSAHRTALIIEQK